MAAQKIYLQVDYQTTDAQKQIDDLNKKITQIGTTTTKASNEASTGVKKITLSFESAADAAKDFQQALVALGVVRAFEKLIHDGEEFARIMRQIQTTTPGVDALSGKLEKLAERLGLSKIAVADYERSLLNAGMAAATIPKFIERVADITTATAKGGIADMEAVMAASLRNMDTISLSGKKVETIFKQLGLNVKKEIADAFEVSSGKELKEMLSHAENAEKVIEFIFARLSQISGVAGASSREARLSLAGHINDLKNATIDLGRTLDQTFGPQLMKIIDFLTIIVKLLDHIVGLFKDLPEPAKDLLAIGAGLLSIAKIGSMLGLGKVIEFLAAWRAARLVGGVLELGLKGAAAEATEAVAARIAARAAVASIMTGAATSAAAAGGAAATGAAAVGAAEGAAVAGGAAAGGGILAALAGLGPAGWAVIVGIVMTAIIAWFVSRGKAEAKDVAAAKAGGDTTADQAELDRLKREAQIHDAEKAAEQKKAMDEAMAEARMRLARSEDDTIGALIDKYSHLEEKLKGNAQQLGRLPQLYAIAAEAEIEKMGKQVRDESRKNQEEIERLRRQTTIIQAETPITDTFAQQRTEAAKALSAWKDDYIGVANLEIEKNDEIQNKRIAGVEELVAKHKMLATDAAVAIAEIQEQQAQFTADKIDKLNAEVQRRDAEYIKQKHKIDYEEWKHLQEEKLAFNQTVIQSHADLERARLEAVPAQTEQQRIEQTQRAFEIQKKLLEDLRDAQLEDARETRRKHLEDAVEGSKEALEIERIYTEKKKMLNLTTDAQIEQARTESWRETNAIIIEEQKEVFSTLQGFLGQIFDDITQGTKSVWEAIGNTIKQTLLGVIKAIVTSA